MCSDYCSGFKAKKFKWTPTSPMAELVKLYTSRNIGLYEMKLGKQRCLLRYNMEFISFLFVLPVTVVSHVDSITRGIICDKKSHLLKAPGQVKSFCCLPLAKSQSNIAKFYFSPFATKSIIIFPCDNPLGGGEPHFRFSFSVILDAP